MVQVCIDPVAMPEDYHDDFPPVDSVDFSIRGNPQYPDVFVTEELVNVEVGAHTYMSLLE